VMYDTTTLYIVYCFACYLISSVLKMLYRHFDFVFFIFCTWLQIKVTKTGIAVDI